VWSRLGYAGISAALGILTGAALFFAWIVASDCGNASIQLTLFWMIILYPITFGVAAASGIIGGFTLRKGALVFAALFALSLAGAGLAAVVPHHNLPYKMQCAVGM
jgi:hypothetical protein